MPKNELIKSEDEKANEKALIEYESFDLSKLEAIKKAMIEDLEGITIEFDRVKIPSGGSTIFEYPTGDPDNPETVKELYGVIVDQYRVNSYWKEVYSGKGVPPDCASLDAEHGIGSPGGDCLHCPLNKFKSDPKGGKGKACKNLYRVYVVRGGKFAPFNITVPPSSLKLFTDFLSKRVVLEGYRPFNILTKITLKKIPASDVPAYSQVIFQVVGPISEEKAAIMEAYSVDLKPATRSQNVQADEYAFDEDERSAIEEEEEEEESGLPI